MMGGLKGAAEYEALLIKNNISNDRNQASIGMDAQSSGHLTYIIFIIVGNIVYFVKRKKEK